MKKLSQIFLLGLVIALLSSCVSTSGLSQRKVKNKVKTNEWPSPKESCLLFGNDYSWNHFLQQNPDIGYQFYSCNTRISEVFGVIVSNLVFLQPLPVGSELKLFSDTVYGYRTVETTYYGIAGVDVVLKEPGLLFYGKDDEKHSKELGALKILLGYFKGTNSQWEEEINKRIKELSDAK